MKVEQLLATLIEGQDLEHDDMSAVMHKMMGGELPEGLLGGFLVALAIKGPSVGELAAAAAAMRALCTPVELAEQPLLDTCGTGGDGAALFNVSTAAAFVAAAAGARVAKHGNRSITSHCGSADVLQLLGVSLELSPQQVARCIEETGIGFLFAPQHHPAMRHVGAVRKQLGVRTIFNLLGPLSNPAGATHQLLGVFAPQWVRPVAEVLGALGSKHALVVHSQDGLDEISIAAPTLVAELRQGEIQEYRLEPQRLGIPQGGLEPLVARTPEDSRRLLLEALENRPGAARDMVCLNAGVAIYAADRCATPEQGVEMARDALGSGLAREKLRELVQLCNLLSGTPPAAKD